MPGRRPVQEGLLGQCYRLAEPQRPDQALAQRRVPLPAVEHLDDPAEHDEAAVAVRVGRAGREDPRGLAERDDVALDAVVPAARVGEDVPVDAAGVRKQVADPHFGRGVVAAEPDAGQDLGDRRVKGQPALVDELHDHRGRPHLGDGPDLEQRVGGGLHSGPGVQHPVRGQALAPVGPDPERGTRDVLVRGKLAEALGPVRSHIG